MSGTNTKMQQQQQPPPPTAPGTFRLRLAVIGDDADVTGSAESGAAGDAVVASEPSPGALKFASFTPMNDQPGSADRKATFVIGTSGLLLSTALFFVTPVQRLVEPGFWPAATLVLALSVVVLILLAGRAAYAAYTMTAPPSPGNQLFVQNIAAASREEYDRLLKSTDTHAALRGMLDYSHTMACLGAAKFRLVQRGMRCLRLAIPLWMLLLLVLTVRG